MRQPRLTLITALALAAASPALPAAAGTSPRSGAQPIVLRPAAAAVSQPVSELSRQRRTFDPNLVIDLEQGEDDEKGPATVIDFDRVPSADGAIDSGGRTPNAMPTPATEFEALSQGDQAAISGFQVSPPDTHGDVGPNHYVECVNLACQVFDKAGNPLPTPGAPGDFTPFTITGLFTALGGECATTNDGDPIVLYDPLADRWLITQFAVTNRPPAFECLAVSTTPDPQGSYNLYAYELPESYFLDYPKLGVWSDGYYLTGPLFEGLPTSVGGQAIIALNRAKMLVGDPSAEAVFFASGADFPGLQRILPADVNGPAPPSGTPNYLLSIAADEFLDTQDGLRLFELHSNWANPAATTLNEIPFPGGSLAVASYDPTLTEVSGNCGVAFTNRDDIEQPAPANCGHRIDSLSNRPMTQLAYRNFGTYESLVFTHTVDVNATPATATSGHHAAPRYYELRRNLPAGSWTVAEQGSFAPDAPHRFMGSAAMDASGNLAVGYTTSSSSVFPSLRYAGRLAGDPAGSLGQGEAVLENGSRSQTSTGSRWGDYASMSVDPADDCTFWFVGEYYGTRVPGGCSTTACWGSRVGKFKFPSCVSPAPNATLSGTVTDITPAPIVGALVQTANGYAAVTDGSGNYSISLPVGTYTATASKLAFSPSQVSGIVVAAGPNTQNFVLGTGVLAGTITDAVSTNPIAGAQVVASNGAAAFTDGSGVYSIPLAAGTYSISVSKPGYTNGSLPGNLVGNSGTTTANLALQPTAVPTATAVAVAESRDGAADPGECARLTITVTNSGSLALTGILATLTPVTAGVTVDSGVSSYPNIAASGGTGANVAPFGISLDGAYPPGQPAQLNLQLQANEGTFNVAVTVVTTGGALQTLPVAGPVAIPDNNPAGTALAIPVSGFAGTLANVAVRVRITHTFDGDLVLRLKGPDNTTVTLSFQRGGAGAGFGTNCPADGNDTTFDDSGVTTLAGGAAPFVGTFRPDSPLAAFRGKSGAQVNGNWQFQAIDVGPADTGNIECVSLILDGTAIGTCGFLSDGFETGNTTAWSAAVQ